MAKVILFNHIEKTAGSTMRHVLFRSVGVDRVLTSFEPRKHVERVAEIARELDRPLSRQYAVAAHTGVGVDAYLPSRHDYVPFTILRDPVDRTVSRYFWGHDTTKRGLGGGLPVDMTLGEYLQENVTHSYNNQTAFLGGLWARHHLQGEELKREQFDRELLDKAKRNLESHAVVGLTDHFDETLLMLRNVYGWKLWQILYRPVNRGKKRRSAPSVSERELEAVRESNQLDLELYEFAKEVFEEQLRSRVPNHVSSLARYRRLNQIYQRAYPYARRPARLALKSGRRLQQARA